MIQPERVKVLNRKPYVAGSRVVYWMQQSQRVTFNHALEYAIEEANELSLPLTVVFGLTETYPDANARHFAFMLQGLKDVRDSLHERGIGFVLKKMSPEKAALEASEDAALLVMDRGYLRHQQSWRKTVAQHAPCQVVQVETDAVVPIDLVSDKEEYAARTIRPKIHRHLQNFLTPLRMASVRCRTRESSVEVDLDDVAAALKELDIDRSVSPVDWIKGGEVQADRVLSTFIKQHLRHYADKRSDPGKDYGSGLSPYLHFGQISPVKVVLAVMETGNDENTQSFIEELVVRRELSFNFVANNRSYDSDESLPSWAVDTLRKHSKDKRPYVYTRHELEEAKTHDKYWNAAQREMVATGRMHNYMRMYWAKKVIEWTERPQIAFETLLTLNNKYFLDGREPNAYANVAWCFGKFDRPWSERDVFGTVRYMNEAGLRRKFDMDAYIERIDQITGTKSSSDPVLDL